MTSRTLGFIFLSPALVMVMLLFLAPVILTGVFGFTNMSTATGITGGSWQVSPGTLNRLADSHGRPSLAMRLEGRRFAVTAPALNKLSEAGVDDAYLDAIRGEILGKSFKDRRALEAALKDLPVRPPNIAALKHASSAFEISLVNRRFESRETLLAGAERAGYALSPAEAEALATAAYTGWTWTTDNFRRMIELPDARYALMRTLFYVFTTLTLFNTGFALILAIGTHYLPDRSGGAIRSIWLLPRVLPPVLYVLMWKWLAWDTGFLSAFLDNFGIASRNWMMDSATNAWIFVILINGFVGASMGMLIFTAAIRAIPAELFHASEVDGAGRWQQVRHIILPQIRWPILFITTYQTLSLLTSFEYILLSTEGGPGEATQTWALMAYQTALTNYAGNLQYGYGAALALILVIVGVVMSLAYLKFFDFRRLVQPPRIER